MKVVCDPVRDDGMTRIVPTGRPRADVGGCAKDVDELAFPCTSRQSKGIVKRYSGTARDQSAAATKILLRSSAQLGSLWGSGPLTVGSIVFRNRPPQKCDFRENTPSSPNWAPKTIVAIFGILQLLSFGHDLSVCLSDMGGNQWSNKNSGRQI